MKKNKISRTAQNHQVRLLLLVCSVLYIGLFNYVYITIVTTKWAYAGFTFESPTIISMMTSLLLGLLPMFVMPIRLTRPSQVLYCLLYAIVYVPSLFLPHYMQRQPTYYIYLLNFSFFISFCIVGLTYKLPLWAIARPKWSEKLWWVFMFVYAGILYAAVLAVYGGRLQFAGLYNIELRLSSRELETTFLTGYGQVWLANVINPIFMALGLFRKKPLLFFIGVAGQILLFMTSADKLFILSIIFLPLLFLLIKTKTNVFGLRFLAGVSLSLILTISLGFHESSSATIIQNLIGFRLFSTAGFMTSVYSDFFSQNPWTYWSHLKGVDIILNYPYDLPIALLIGEFTGDVENCANAHAWATDGISAMGLSGVLVVGLLMGLVFYMLDVSASGLDPRLSGLSIAMHGIALSNLSILSTCLGGGLFFHMTLFYLMSGTSLSRNKPLHKTHLILRKIKSMMTELKNKLALHPALARVYVFVGSILNQGNDPCYYFEKNEYSTDSLRKTYAEVLN